MSKAIKTVDLEKNQVMVNRDILEDDSINSIDVNQTDGTFLVVQPLSDSGTLNGQVVIYPQSPVPEIYEPVILRRFNRFGNLTYPLDAKFSYIRRRIWIADTGNHRILRVNIDTEEATLGIEDSLFYPHALAVNLNNGGIFAKGYTSLSRNQGVVCYFRLDGLEVARFVYDLMDVDSSSSSSFSGSMSSSSSSGQREYPQLPSANSIAYDHVRSRAWWVEDSKVYMFDERNYQVQAYDLSDDGYYFTYSLDIELDTGNAFIVVGNNHDDRFLLQMFRDNNNLLAASYIVSVPYNPPGSSSSSSDSSDSS